MTVYDAAVVGCGGIGSAALYWLARRGAWRVLGLDQFRLGHDRGASQDHSRMIRKAYAQRHYTTLIGAAYDAWREVEDESGLELVIRTGAVDLALAGTAGAAHLDACIDAMRHAGIEHSELDAAEVTSRWPQFRLPPRTRAVYQADGGLWRPLGRTPCTWRWPGLGGRRCESRSPSRASGRPATASTSSPTRGPSSPAASCSRPAPGPTTTWPPSDGRGC